MAARTAVFWKPPVPPREPSVDHFTKRACVRGRAVPGIDFEQHIANALQWRRHAASVTRAGRRSRQLSAPDGAVFELREVIGPTVTAPAAMSARVKIEP